MRFLDEKGRVFGKISIIDLVIVLVVVIAGGWFAYAKFGRDLQQEVAAREQPVEFTVVVNAIRPTTVDAIKKGGKVFEFKTGVGVGTIKEVKSEPADTDIWTINEDGRWLRTKAPDRLYAYVTVTAIARVGENVITVNGVEVRVGTSIGLQSKWAVFTGYIMTVELLEGGTSK